MQKLLIVFIIIFFITLNLFCESNDSLAKRIEYNSNKYKYILEMILSNYVDSVKIDDLSEEAYSTILNSLDKHSIYLKKDNLYKKQVSDAGSEIGIGLDLRVYNDTAFVYEVLENSPASVGGINSFDRILSINGNPVTGNKLADILKLLKGPVNSNLEIEIEKAYSKKNVKLNLKREPVKISSLNISLMIPNTIIGLISSKKFSRISHEEFQFELKKLLSKGMKYLIIDLRDNPGGFLEEVGKIIDEFFKVGDTLTFTKAKNQVYNQLLLSKSGGCCEDIPLVLILNENSASACELFAGAVQDLDRGLVVGNRTFGKSSVQMLWKMNDSSGFQMTVAEYFTPNGRSLEKKNKDDVKIDEALKLNLNDTAFSQLSKYINEYGSESKIPIYYSRKGRTLMGGGGIFPDVFIDIEKNTLLTNVLNQRNILIESVYLFLKDNMADLKNKYGNDLSKFMIEFNVTDLMLSDLKRHSLRMNIWNEEMFQKDKFKIRNLIKAEIARAFFGNLGYYSVAIQNDNCISKAIEVLPEAENLLNK